MVRMAPVAPRKTSRPGRARWRCRPSRRARASGGSADGSRSAPALTSARYSPSGHQDRRVEDRAATRTDRRTGRPSPSHRRNPAPSPAEEHQEDHVHQEVQEEGEQVPVRVGNHRRGECVGRGVGGRRLRREERDDEQDDEDQARDAGDAVPVPWARPTPDPRRQVPPVPIPARASMTTPLSAADPPPLGAIWLESVNLQRPRAGGASSCAASAFRATAVSTSHRVAELPGPTTTQ